LLYAQEYDGVRKFSPCIVFANTHPEGLGITITSDMRCDYGFFRDSLLDGKGRITFRSGDIYDGYFNEGKFKGIGTVNIYSRYLL
jgi:hypothetical protein